MTSTATRSVAAILGALALAACAPVAVPEPERVDLSSGTRGDDPFYWRVPATGEGTPLYEAPRRDSPVVETLPADTTVEVRNLGCTPADPSLSPRWCRVETANRVGWLPAAGLTAVP